MKKVYCLFLYYCFAKECNLLIQQNFKNLSLPSPSLIFPHFDYTDIIWQSAPKKYLDMLQKLQNRAGRIILKINPYSHISTFHIHEVLNWKLLSVRQEEHICIMMYKILNNLIPEYIKRPIPIKTDRYFSVL